MAHLKDTLLFRDMKLKHKLMLMIAVILAVISIATFSGFRYVISRYDALLYSQTAVSLSFFSDELTNRLKSIEAVSSYIGIDSSFQENLNVFNTSSRYELSSMKAKNNITDLFNRFYTSDMDHITVLTLDGTPLWWGKSAFAEPKNALKTLIGRCDAAKGGAVWAASGESRILCARKILQVKNLSLMPMGYLIIEVDLDDMVTSLLRPKNSGGQQFEIFINARGEIIYPSGSAEDSAPYAPLSFEQSSYAIKKAADSRMFITYTKLPLDTVDWSISLAVPYDDIFRSLNHMVPMFALCLLLAVVIASALAGNIVSNITKQFHLLVDKMDSLTLDGVMEQPSRDALALPTASQDEIAILNAYFDRMIGKLKKLIEDNYLKQLLMTQAELKALEQQVNPHFLYNTLNTVNWLAIRAGSKEISDIAQALGSMLRNTLGGGQTIHSLENELVIVSSYIKIQQIRFDELVVDLHIDPSALQAQVPKMTIQPLIENAILHSQEDVQENYFIRLTAAPAGDAKNIVIRVENSGSHIDENILERIENHTVTPKGNGIGLANINARLRIVFGEQACLHFENVDNMAVIWFLIPCQECDN